MLTDRRSALLNLIVEEYVDTALPVGSQVHRAQARHAGVSSATVRMEMARLEDEGFISQPHTSAGRVPSDKGYRYYVESLMAEESLPCEERETIRHQFHQAERAMEQWFQLAAAVLAHSVSNFAVVTSPRSKETRLRHVQLVPLQETERAVRRRAERGAHPPAGDQLPRAGRPVGADWSPPAGSTSASAACR